MSLRRTTTAAAAVALAAACLAGCSFGTKKTAEPLPVPTPRPTHSAPAPTPSPTPSRTPSPSPTEQTTTATSAPPPPPATSTAATTEQVTSYKHLVVKLPVTHSSVPEAPAGFLDYLTSALDADWTKLGHTQGCEKAASIQVLRISSLGYAMVARNIDPAIPTCVKAASYAGGYQAILGAKSGVWTELLGLQDEPACSEMKRLGVPKSIYQNCN